VRLVDDLLDVSRITSGKVALRRAQVDLAAVVEAAVETSRPLIEACGHALTVALPPEPVYVDGDAVRLAQVVSNLLNNAAKYTPAGGHVRAAAGREGGDAVVRVADTGVGIPGEMLGKVFDLFTQVERSLDRSQGGLGVGLTLVKRLVEMHGGSVEAYSAGAGHGAAVAGAAAEFRPGVVLLDIGLPGVDGYEVARRLRAEPAGGEMLLVAMTGYGQEGDRRRSLEAGFDAHLVKPVDLNELQAVMADFPRP